MTENRTYTSGTIAKVIDYYKIVLNRGASDGIESGMVFIIYEVGEDILDPETGKSLGPLEIYKGKGKVLNIQEKMSILEPLKYTVPLKRQSGTALLSSLYGGTTETVETAQDPFENVIVGDKVRFIGRQTR